MFIARPSSSSNSCRTSPPSHKAQNNEKVPHFTDKKNDDDSSGPSAWSGWVRTHHLPHRITLSFRKWMIYLEQERPLLYSSRRWAGLGLILSGLLLLGWSATTTTTGSSSNTQQFRHRPTHLPHVPRLLRLVDDDEQDEEVANREEMEDDLPIPPAFPPKVERWMSSSSSSSLTTHTQQSPSPWPWQLNVPGTRELALQDNPMPQDSIRMKPGSTMDKGQCQRIADWQISHHPNCNVIHESSWGFSHPRGMPPDTSTKRRTKHSNPAIAAITMTGKLAEGEGDTDAKDRSSPSLDEEKDEGFEDLKYEDVHEEIRLVAGGSFRWVWMIREFDGTRRALKTLRVDSKNFDLRNFDRHRRDAVAMDELTTSPLVVDMYGFCSNSGLFDWGEGGDLERVFDLDPPLSKDQLLRIAFNVSLSIHHAHHFDDRGRATMAHTDIKPDQFLFQDGYYRLTDFNRMRFLSWNQHKDTPCGFKIQKNGGNWRAPEEYNYEYESEKVDVYSLGNVLYFMLTQEEPWARYRSKTVYAKVKAGERPVIPDTHLRSTHPFDSYMIEAMRMAWTHDKFDRPGALQVAQKLQEGIALLDSGRWKEEDEMEKGGAEDEQ